MANRDIFAKHLPNVKLATRFDAEGQEVQVERREDADALAKELATFDLLVSAGYYRARIKGLSGFDKVVGGMTWCIECCDYDIDVDLLFHESLTIGQKITLVEKIVSVLHQMKCPYSIEPHQIQGLEFLAIHPIIKWLIKATAENRIERGQRLKRFSVGQFHNYFQYKTDKEHLNKIRSASKYIKKIQESYIPCRLYNHQDRDSNDEKMHVRLVLLEYDDKNSILKFTTNQTIKKETDLVTLKGFESQSELEKLFNNPTIAKLTTYSVPILKLDTKTRKSLQKHYAEFKLEMETDAKQLNAQNRFKCLERSKIALENKIMRYEYENAEFEKIVVNQNSQKDYAYKQLEKFRYKCSQYRKITLNTDTNLLKKVQSLLAQHDELKKLENDFKEECRKDLSNLQKDIVDLELFNAQDPDTQLAAVAKERTYIQIIKLQLAKCNRGIVAIERKLDTMPDRTELAQYQRRFHELYNEMSAKHLETKKYYTLYNTLNDKKRYLEKELSLLNSICDAYNEGMLSPHGREDFMHQFESIVEGVQHAENKVRQKCNEARLKRDSLNDELHNLLELQRQYAVSVKKLTEECQSCEQYQQRLNSIRQKY